MPYFSLRTFGTLAKILRACLEYIQTKYLYFSNLLSMLLFCCFCKYYHVRQIDLLSGIQLIASMIKPQKTVHQAQKLHGVMKRV